MKNRLNIFLRMAPVLIVCAVTGILSVFLFRNMISSETEVCWQRIEATTKSVAEKMNARLDDNINMLSLVADAIAMKSDFEQHDEILEYLSTVQSMTIFSRVEIMFPDNRILTQEGEYTAATGGLSYDRIMLDGYHISPRFDDPRTGKKSFYCIAPINSSEKNIGLLVGIVECEDLPDIFPVFLFDGDVDSFIIGSSRRGKVLKNRIK